MALFGASTINESMTLSARTSQDASGERRGTGRIKYSWEGHHDPHQTVKCSAVRTQDPDEERCAGYTDQQRGRAWGDVAAWGHAGSLTCGHACSRLSPVGWPKPRASWLTHQKAALWAAALSRSEEVRRGRAPRRSAHSWESRRNDP